MPTSAGAPPSAVVTPAPVANAAATSRMSSIDGSPPPFSDAARTQVVAGIEAAPAVLGDAYGVGAEHVADGLCGRGRGA